MHIKTCNYSILHNEVKDLLLIDHQSKNIHEFNVLNLNLWIHSTPKKKYPLFAYFTLLSPKIMLEQTICQ